MSRLYLFPSANRSYTFHFSLSITPCPNWYILTVTPCLSMYGVSRPWSMPYPVPSSHKCPYPVSPSLPSYTLHSPFSPTLTLSVTSSRISHAVTLCLSLLSHGISSYILPFPVVVCLSQPHALPLSVTPCPSQAHPAFPYQSFLKLFLSVLSDKLVSSVQGLYQFCFIYEVFFFGAKISKNFDEILSYI